ncbi:response regulator [Haladaptatus sp. NG-SE-30]
MTESDDIGVLIVDDEPEVTELYRQWLSEFRTHAVNDGRRAIRKLDEFGEELDIVLLDRKMPGLSGEGALEVINDCNYDCQVAMITAIAPNYDIIDMQFDEYVTKPVDGDTLRRTVWSLHNRAEYADQLAHYYSLVATHASLVAERPRVELRQSDEFSALESEIEAVRSTLDGFVDLSDHREFQHVLREIG